MADRDIAVRFTGDSRDLERASEKAERSISDTGKSMGGALAGLAGPATIAAAAVAGVAIVGYDLAKAAAEDEASMAQLAQQLRQAAGAGDEAVAGAEDFVSALSKSAALADDELRPALARLATATGDTARAQDLLALATDISAGSGKDLGAVTDALAKAALGSTGGLSKLGLATEDAAGKAMPLEEILARARDTFKGAGEAAANTSEGGMRKAAIGFDELKESIGAKLLPILGGLGTFLTETVLPAFEQLIAWAEAEWPKFMEAIRPTLEQVGELVRTVIDNLKAFWDENGDEIMAGIGELVRIWKEVLSVELQAAGELLKTVFDEVARFWDENGDEIMATLREVATFISDTVNTIRAFWTEWGDEIMTVARTVFDTVLTVIRVAMDVIFGIIRFVAAVIRGDWGAAFEALKDTAAAGVDFVVGLMGKVGGLITDALGALADLITRPFKAAFNAIADLWNNTIGRLEFTVPDWVPGLGGNRIDVPDIPRFAAFGALTIVMPPGSDGYDVARQVTSFSRNVAPMGALTVAVR
ncbi:MAG TPA: hypothetical protein VJM49_13610 [Acidimicrobiales bacterium]|nr:hypothetical protein [Acidimicrobiales bacterium]